jgi:hypothetical protein
MTSTKSNRNSKNLPSDRKGACDQIITGAARLMVHEVGASVPDMVDRLLTYAAAQSCKTDGAASTAAAFRTMADRIESGAFAALEPKRNVQ